jgi:hypothetical protein
MGGDAVGVSSVSLTLALRSPAAVFFALAACRSSPGPAPPDRKPDSAPDAVASAIVDASPSAVAPPPSSADVGAALPDIERTVTLLRGRYRRCLAMATDLPSAVDITIDIAATGPVARVEVSSRPALPADARRCIEDSTKTTRFPTPDGGAATLKIPIRF